MMDKMGSTWGMGHMYPGCGCMGGMGMKHGFERKYYTKAEKAEWLKDRIKEMEMELAGMKEKLAGLDR
jgi:hypothetical protein